MLKIELWLNILDKEFTDIAEKEFTDRGVNLVLRRKGSKV